MGSRKSVNTDRERSINGYFVNEDISSALKWSSINRGELFQKNNSLPGSLDICILCYSLTTNLHRHKDSHIMSNIPTSIRTNIKKDMSTCLKKRQTLLADNLFIHISHLYEVYSSQELPKTIRFLESLGHVILPLSRPKTDLHEPFDQFDLTPFEQEIDYNQRNNSAKYGNGDLADLGPVKLDPQMTYKEGSLGSTCKESSEYIRKTGIARQLVVEKHQLLIHVRNYLATSSERKKGKDDVNSHHVTSTVVNYASRLLCVMLRKEGLLGNKFLTTPQDINWGILLESLHAYYEAHLQAYSSGSVVTFLKYIKRFFRAMDFVFYRETLTEIKGEVDVRRQQRNTFNSRLDIMISDAGKVSRRKNIEAREDRSEVLLGYHYYAAVLSNEYLVKYVKRVCSKDPKDISDMEFYRLGLYLIAKLVITNGQRPEVCYKLKMRDFRLRDTETGKAERVVMIPFPRNKTNQFNMMMGANVETIQQMEFYLQLRKNRFSHLAQVENEGRIPFFCNNAGTYICNISAEVKTFFEEVTGNEMKWTLRMVRNAATNTCASRFLTINPKYISSELFPAQPIMGHSIQTHIRCYLTNSAAIMLKAFLFLQKEAEGVLSSQTIVETEFNRVVKLIDTNKKLSKSLQCVRIKDGFQESLPLREGFTSYLAVWNSVDKHLNIRILCRNESVIIGPDIEEGKETFPLSFSASMNSQLKLESLRYDVAKVANLASSVKELLHDEKDDGIMSAQSRRELRTAIITMQLLGVPFIILIHTKANNSKCALYIMMNAMDIPPILNGIDYVEAPKVHLIYYSKKQLWYPLSTNGELPKNPKQHWAVPKKSLTKVCILCVEEYEEACRLTRNKYINICKEQGTTPVLSDLENAFTNIIQELEKMEIGYALDNEIMQLENSDSKLHRLTKKKRRAPLRSNIFLPDVKRLRRDPIEQTLEDSRQSTSDGETTFDGEDQIISPSQVSLAPRRGRNYDCSSVHMALNTIFYSMWRMPRNLWKNIYIPEVYVPMHLQNPHKNLEDTEALAANQKYHEFLEIIPREQRKGELCNLGRGIRTKVPISTGKHVLTYGGPVFFIGSSDHSKYLKSLSNENMEFVDAYKLESRSGDKNIVQYGHEVLNESNIIEMTNGEKIIFLGPLVNHSKVHANLRGSIKKHVFKGETIIYFLFTASKPIRAMEELLWNYGDDVDPSFMYICPCSTCIGKCHCSKCQGKSFHTNEICPLKQLFFEVFTDEEGIRISKVHNIISILNRLLKFRATNEKTRKVIEKSSLWLNKIENAELDMSGLRKKLLANKCVGVPQVIRKKIIKTMVEKEAFTMKELLKFLCYTGTPIFVVDVRNKIPTLYFVNEEPHAKYQLPVVGGIVVSEEAGTMIFHQLIMKDDVAFNKNKNIPLPVELMECIAIELDNIDNVAE